ncbi:MAG: hypothetical protein ITG00_09190 [Flavobacterium sp.]|nr:hypothetical protein [Flavobacterium sp.]
METNNSGQNQRNRDNQYDDNQANEPLNAGNRNQDMGQDSSRRSGQSLSGSQNRDAGQEWGNEIGNDNSYQGQGAGGRRDDMNTASMDNGDEIQNRDSSFSSQGRNADTENWSETQNMQSGSRDAQGENWNQDNDETRNASSRSRNDDRNQTV